MRILRRVELMTTRKEPHGAVLVIHSWWGATPAFRTYAKRLARRGFVVGVADLFDGEIAETPAHAKRLRAKKRTRPMYRTLEENLATLRQEVEGCVAVVGFSMGGHWAVWLAQRPEYEVSAAVLYYAVRAGDFKKSKASYLAHFADDDPWVKPAARRRMERALGISGCPYEAYDYPGTEHWFAEAGEDEYDAKAASLAFERTVAFLLS